MQGYNIDGVGTLCLGDVYLKYNIQYDDRPIIITFSHLGSNVSQSDALSGCYDPWGFNFVVSEGFNVLSFCCINGNNWYTGEEFQKKISHIGKSLGKFDVEIIGYGGSMGGFGVSALANPLGIQRMLLFNPISTLNPEKVPFETRFRPARKNLNWHCMYNDGAEAKADGCVIYDPFFEVDALHAKRYTNLEKLKFPGVGHSIPKHLSQINALKWVFRSFVNGGIDRNIFSRKQRRKRNYSHYYKWMLSPENQYLTSKRRQVISKYYDAHKLISGDGRVVDNKDVNKIRNLAVQYENKDVKLSSELMNIAARIKPDGSYIAKKKEEYLRKIRQY